MARNNGRVDRIESYIGAIESYEPQLLVDHVDAYRLFARFVSRSIDARYLQRHPVPELLGDMEHLLAAGRSRQPDEIRIRVESVAGDSNRAVIFTCVADQPFVVSTVERALDHLDLRPYRLLSSVVPIRRDPSGELDAVGVGGATPESFVRTEVEGTNASGRIDEIEQHLREHLEALQVAVADHAAMLEVLGAAARGLAAAGSEGGVESARLLDWLPEHFVFLGMRFFQAPGVRSDLPDRLGSGRLDAVFEFADPEAGIARAAEGPNLVTVHKSRAESWTYRPGYTDRVHVPCRTPEGEPAGLLVVDGLFSYEALAQPNTEIPVLDRTAESLYEIFEVSRGSHRYRSVRNAFNSLPMEYLFGLSVEEVAAIVGEILDVEVEHRSKLLVSAAPHRGAAFVLIALPRALYSEDFRIDARRLLMEELRATAGDDGAHFGRAGTVTLHYYLPGAEASEVDVDSLENEVAKIASPWVDRLVDELESRYERGEAQRLHAIYADGFPAHYREQTSAARAARDIAQLEELGDAEPFACDIYREPADEKLGVSRLRLFSLEAMPLSVILPLLDNLGLVVFDESTATVSVPGRAERTVATFRVSGAEGVEQDLLSRRNRLRDAIRAAFSGALVNDALNKLLLRGDISWPYVAMLRAYRHYVRQLGLEYGNHTVFDVLLQNGDVCRGLAELFRAKFDPSIEGLEGRPGPKRATVVERARKLVLELLDGVADLTSDQILRSLYVCIDATVRTNFYAANLLRNPIIALKFEPARIERMPNPKPYREIFVHHPQVDGVHLRGGPIARGGLRWSERLLDFRTEILGLMATQNLKNVLIVPRGAKGGFVLSHPPADPAMRRAAVDAAYEIFISGLLSVTDNLVDGNVVAPPGLICYDEPDHYLVVAADKGTAHLSDTANRIAVTHDFWLGDAFASGGSKGYDHKVLGITARGAWECVRRHFREVGVNPEVDRIRVAGVGDMSGDVFGNGMLLSRSIQLVAAFDHRHIFIDPDPDPAKSWEARRLLFETPRSSWADYPAETLSPGGGVYSRRAKSIPLSAQARELLEIENENPTGEQVIQAILSLPVDLFWNGGIGTYVKASHESHLDVGDPTNDAVRVDAPAVRARVIGEGGNLGLTPEARIELALNGVRLNSDAIDNSAGVDMSDHEVNLKILLQPATSSGRMSASERDGILEGVQDRVVAQVLGNNWSQGRMLSLDQLRSRADPRRFVRASEFLCDRLGLRRRDLHLPGSRVVEERVSRGEGLTRPELAVLAATAKLDMREQLRSTRIFEVERLAGHLLEYFPPAIREAHREDIVSHPLGVNIAWTAFTNEVVDTMGATWLAEATLRTGRSTDVVLEAHQRACRWLDGTRLFAELDALEMELDAKDDYAVRLLVSGEVERVCHWILRRSADIGDDFGELLSKAMNQEESPLAPDHRALAPALLERLPTSLAHSLGRLSAVDPALDVAWVALLTQLPVEEARARLLEIGGRIGLLPRLWEAAADLSDNGPPRFALTDQLRRHLVRLTVELARSPDGLSSSRGDWLERLQRDAAPLARNSGLENLVLVSDRISRRLEAGLPSAG